MFDVSRAGSTAGRLRYRLLWLGLTPGVLRTERLLLRPLCNDDVAIITAAALESLPELLPWMGWAHPEYGAEDAEGWIAFAREMWSIGREFCFGMFREEPQGCLTYLGNCGLDRVDWTVRSANLGYWIRTSEVGKGYATEAARAVAGWAFRVHKLHRIEIIVEVGNARSQRTALRTGACDEGVGRNRLVLRSEPRDARVYSLIPADLAVDRPAGAD